MTGEFLLEIGTEEIPAGFVNPALKSLVELFGKGLDSANLSHGEINVFATPRRLIVSIPDLPDHQGASEVIKTGPAKASAYNADGSPTKAAIGFAKGQGVAVEDLILIDTPKGQAVGIRRSESGRSTKEILAELCPSIMERISFPKTMRWMDLDVRFARPIHWIVALYEGEPIEFQYGNISSGVTSYGHRFVSPEPFEVKSFDDLRSQLAQRSVVIDPQERKERIFTEVKALGERDGLTVLDDPGLLEEINYLVESPFPIMGEFAPEFLELPASILITCMKKHQRYFSLYGKDGHITNRFVAINNTPVKDTAVAVKGNQRVLKARLEDAKFYFKEDRKKPLIMNLEALRGVVFHSKLGLIHDKVMRFTRLAKLLTEKLAPEKSDAVERAALLCKCDLETGIVYEFPELQGIIGSFYARLDGEPEDVYVAIREHYLPTHAGGELPQGIVGAVISIADRMDTIVGCFSVGLIPTGTADPYALRRNALGIIQILIDLNRSLDLNWLIAEAFQGLAKVAARPADETERDVKEFIRTRFVNYHTGRDYPLDVVEAVVRARFDDIIDARRRVEALSAWRSGPEFETLIVGFKRVMNILKKAAPGRPNTELFTEDAEKELFATFTAVSAAAEPYIVSGEYGTALEEMGKLKAPIDTFFDKVMVMVEDEKIRNNRLSLLAAIGGLFTRIADFSFIGSTAQ